MTYHSPRIYVYKITFEEVPYYYYGVHKEKGFNEYYMGTPVTNKWCWELYTPKKQILQFFDFTDEGWLEALEVEKRLIKPFYQTDKWCLNESCGAKISIKQSIKAGRKGGKVVGKLNGEKAKKLGLGICGLTYEERVKYGKIGLEVQKQNNLGLYGLSAEDKSNAGKKGIETQRKLGLGVFGRTSEQQSQLGKKGGKIAAKNTNFQRWECTETGFITNPGNLTKYQIKRGIDTSKRRRIS